MDRSAISRALAKAIAHKHAGNESQAREWAAHLVWLLECADVLSDDIRAGGVPISMAPER